MIGAQSLVLNKRHRPREEFSPSQLSMAERCRRSWVLRYLHGLKGEGNTKSQMRGSLIHASFEEYMHGRGFGLELKTLTNGKVHDPLAKLRKELGHWSEEEQREMIADAPVRAMAASHLLPDPAGCTWIKTETPLHVDTREVCPDIEPIVWSPMSALDLVYKTPSGIIDLVDYKSTKGGNRKGEGFDPWLYVPAEESLRNDVQWLLESLATMQAYDLQALPTRWIYTLTAEGKSPQARALALHAERRDVVRRLVPWVRLANDLRREVRCAIAFGRPPTLDSVPQPSKLHPDPDAPCSAYGGCAYHAKRNGPCNPAPAIADVIAQLIGETTMTQPAPTAPVPAFAGGATAAPPAPFYQDPTGAWRHTATNELYVPPATPPAAPYSVAALAASAPPVPPQGDPLLARLAAMAPGAVAMLPPEGQLQVAQAQGLAPAPTGAPVVVPVPPPLPATLPTPPATTAPPPAAPAKRKGKAANVAADPGFLGALRALLDAASAAGVKCRVVLDDVDVPGGGE